MKTIYLNKGDYVIMGIGNTGQAYHYSNNIDKVSLYFQLKDYKFKEILIKKRR